MICNPAGVAIIREFEGCSLTPYQDGAGIFTQGYGHTGGVTANSPLWTQRQADDQLLADMGNVEAGVTRIIRRPLSSNQFSALVSLAYNIGLGNFSASTVAAMLNAGLFAQAPAAFMKWVKIKDPATGELVVSDGLVRRRSAEVRLFNTPDGS